MTIDHNISILENHFNRLLGEIHLFKSFYSDRQSMELLGKVGYDTFALIQRPLMDSIVLIICRMYDPAQTCGKNNITFFYIQTLLTSKKDEFLTLIKKQRECIAVLRGLRNQIIGHSDLNEASLPVIEYRGASHDEIHLAVEGIRTSLEFLNDVVRNALTVYSGVDMPNGSPEVFLERLKQIKVAANS